MLQLRPFCIRDCTGQLWTGKSLARVPWAGVAIWERYGIGNSKQGRQISRASLLRLIMLKQLEVGTAAEV